MLEGESGEGTGGGGGGGGGGEGGKGGGEIGAMSKTRTVLSLPPEASDLPSAEKETESTSWPWARGGAAVRGWAVQCG